MDIWRHHPSNPEVIPGGAPDNPMGVAAVGLDRGTNNPGSVGHFVSHGCIRMHNRDITNLYRRARAETKMTVLR